MSEFYQTNSYATSTGAAISELAIMKKRTAIAVNWNIFHPKGGGQPEDRGCIVIRNRKFQLNRLIKQGKAVYHQLDSRIEFHDELEVGENVQCYLDWDYRYQSMRYHTAAHILMASARSVLPGFIPEGVVINEDHLGGTIKFCSSKDVMPSDCVDITNRANKIVEDDHCISSIECSSLESARDRYGPLFRFNPDTNLRGRIRVVVIDGIDANPCGGTHTKRTSEVGGINQSSCDASSLTFILDGLPPELSKI